MLVGLVWLVWRFDHATYLSRSKTRAAFKAFAMGSVRLRISIHELHGDRSIVELSPGIAGRERDNSQ